LSWPPPWEVNIYLIFWNYRFMARWSPHRPEEKMIRVRIPPGCMWVFLGETQLCVCVIDLCIVCLIFNDKLRHWPLKYFNTTIHTYTLAGFE
jgi:hypothetical protein